LGDYKILKSPQTNNYSFNIQNLSIIPIPAIDMIRYADGYRRPPSTSNKCNYCVSQQEKWCTIYPAKFLTSNGVWFKCRFSCWSFFTFWDLYE